MGSEHYFSDNPESTPNFRPLKVTLNAESYVLTTANGVFSPERIDQGTEVLLKNMPPAPPSGDILDLGCGWGPISLSLAQQCPHATVWAVDVNERALQLVQKNAETLGLSNIRACLPDQVPEDLKFVTIRSNPPIRVGKNVLHDMMMHWIPKIKFEGDCWLVVQKNLGADSLHRWLEASLGQNFSLVRAATSKGFRVIRIRNQRPTANL